MYPSNNILNSYTNLDHTTLLEPYNINNPNSKLEDHSPSSFFYQPLSPFNLYDDAVFHLLLQQQQQQQQQPSPLLHHHHHHQEAEDSIEAITAQEDHQNKMPNMVDFNTTKSQMVQKRTSKKDRHSKINTAQGPRDRRMRLSLEVAREFFDLQDVLGFDKASKTVEWLLIRSRDAIKELTRDPMKEKSFISFGANSASSTSECEVVSGPVRVDTEKPSSVSVKPKKVKGARKYTFLPRDKESREKARERARERTKANRRPVEARLPLEAMDSNPNSDLGDVDQEMIFSYDHNNNGVSQEHQFTDYQVYGEPWGASYST